MDVSEVLEKNEAVLQEVFTGMESGAWYDGLSHQVYLDLDDGEIMICTFASENSWLQRDDGSLVKLKTVSGYSDLPEDELYDPETCSKYDFGWPEFMDEMYNRVDEALTN